MRRMGFVMVVALSVASPTFADVTIKQTMTGKGLGMAAASTATAYIKGNKMRSDAVIGDRTVSTIFDLDAQKMYAFDSKKKEADVWDMAAFAQELGAAVDTANMKVSLKPNGQTKEIAGKTATGYDLDIVVPTTLGNNKEMKMLVTMSGPTWIVKGAPGTQDYVHFYRAAVEKGWIFTDPRAAKGAPGQAKAMAEMYKQLADAGGVPYETDVQLKMDMGAAGGPMAGLFGKMGNSSMAWKVESIETGAVSEDLFAPPAGYKLNQKK